MTILRSMLLAIATVVVLSGCGTMNSVVPPSTDLEFNVAKDVNPDPNGRPSPVVVRVLELNSRSVFDSQDFFALYDNPEAALGEDLLSKDELVLEPGEEKSYEMRLDRKTRFIAVMAAYRDLEHSRWRDVVVADPEGYDSFDVKIGKLSISIKD
ncbi:type VI secretion system lipoprotein TssJ [Pokkaliibacter sp. CJK22405]|uniref:type VI secretion system lipoprotein TssJ n=1 Tax=Pokkaliibacter sp. CJK22405 TaxID=3384615 RepID=UPI003984A8B5